MKSTRLVLLSFSVAIAGGLFVPLAYADQRPDVSLMPIAADEPIPPLGFPPLPARLDLPIAQTAPRSNYKPSPQKFYGGGYIHDTLPTRDAFSQPEPANYRKEQARTEPVYQRSNQSNSQPRVEAPQPVMIDQPHTQDLSMPDDEPKNSGGSSHSKFSRNKQQLQNNLIRKPLMNLRGKFGI